MLNITVKNKSETDNIYQSTREHEIYIYKAAEKINNKIKNIFPGGYMFMKWYPYRIGTPTCEDAFIRETVNYYILIGECAKYLWYNKNFKDFLEKFDFYVDIYADKFFNTLRGMRHFFCHRYNPIGDENLKFVCDFFGITGSDDIEYEDLENGYVSIKKDDKFWNHKREELFSSVLNYLNDLNLAVDRIFENNKEEFINEWKNAIASWYSIEVYHWKKLILSNLEAMCEEVPFGDVERLKSYIESSQRITNITKNLSKKSNLFKDAFNHPYLENLEPIYVLDVILKNEFDRDKLSSLAAACK